MPGWRTVAVSQRNPPARAEAPVIIKPFSRDPKEGKEPASGSIRVLRIRLAAKVLSPMPSVRGAGLMAV